MINAKDSVVLFCDTIFLFVFSNSAYLCRGRTWLEFKVSKTKPSPFESDKYTPVIGTLPFYMMVVFENKYVKYVLSLSPTHNCAMLLLYYNRHRFHFKMPLLVYDMHSFLMKCHAKQKNLKGKK